MTAATRGLVDDTQDLGKSWMLLFQGGDDDAFRRIVQHYSKQVSLFFVRTGADASAAEDLSQEVFLRIYRARQRYEPTAKFSTWLHRIVHRIAINDGTRNRWRRSVSFNQDPDDSGSPHASRRELVEDHPDADPQECLRRDELRSQVRAAVDTLPDTQKTALILNRFQGLSYEEVGDVLGLKLPAVKSLLFRARENLKKAILPELGEETRS